MNQDPGDTAYAFICDRLADQRDEQHPDGHTAYVDAFRGAQELHQRYTAAVHDNAAEAAQHLAELHTIASQWRTHPHHPAG